MFSWSFLYTSEETYIEDFNKQESLDMVGDFQTPTSSLKLVQRNSKEIRHLQKGRPSRLSILLVPPSVTRTVAMFSFPYISTST
jgi:hypothetical protein